MASETTWICDRCGKREMRKRGDNYTSPVGTRQFRIETWVIEKSGGQREEFTLDLCDPCGGAALQMIRSLKIERP